MQDNKTNRDKLYTFLTNKGVTGIGADREEFETIFEDEGKQKKLYDFCVNKGYTGIGKNYDEFAGGFSIQKGAHGAVATILEQASGVPYPAPEVDKSQYTFTGEQLGLENPAESPEGDEYRFTGIGKDYKIEPSMKEQFGKEGLLNQSAEEYMTDVQKNIDSRKVGMDFEKLRQEQGINAGRSNVVKKEGRYYTEAGSFDNYSQAAYEADMAKEYNGVPMREIAEYYSLDENKRAGYAKSVGRTPEEIEKAYESKEKGDINNQMSDLYRRIDAGIRGVNQKKSALQSQYEKERGFGGFITDALMSGAAAELPVLQGQLPGSALEGSREWRNLDKQEKMLWASARQFNTAQKIINAAKSGDFFTGMGDALQDLVLGGSVQDMQDLAAINEVSRKFEKGEKLTAKEEMLLESIAMNVAVASQYKDEISAWYNAGNMVGEMIPYMVEMWMNPLSKLGKKFGQKVLERAKEKYGKDLAKHLVSTKIKTGAGKLGGAALGGYGMSLTTGLPSVITGVQERTLGDAVIDKEMSGDVKYAGRRDAEGLGTAIYKETTQKMLDNASEMLGAGYAKIPFKWLQKVGKGTKVLGWIDNLANSKFGKGVSQFAEKTKWHGPIEEFLEEVHVGLLNPVLGGDQSWGKFFTADNLATIAIGVAVPGAVISTANTIAGAADGAFKVGAQERWKMKNAEAMGYQLWQDNPNEWNDLTRSLMVGQMEDIEKTLKEVYNNPNLTPEQKKTALEYGVYSLQWRTARGVEEAFNEGKKFIDPMLREVYSTAYAERVSPVQANNAYKAMAEAEKNAQRVLGIGDRSVDEWLNGRSAEEVTNNPARQEAIKAYQAAKLNFEGRRDRYIAEKERAYMESDKSIQANDNNGMVYATQLKDKPVYITDGNVALYEDGTIDANNSSEVLYAKFPDGHVEMISPDKFTEVFTSDRTADLKAAKRAEINDRWRAEFDTAEAQAIEQERREAGTVFDKADSMGVHRIEILNEGEQMSDILIDGKQEQIPTEELNSWKQEAGIQSTENRVQRTDAVEMPDVPDFFRLNGKNYEVASRNDDGSVDVMIDGKRETLPAGTDYSTSMPTDKKGEVQYEKMPVERTHEHFVQKVTDNEARAEMIEKRRKKAEDERKKFDKKPDPGLDPDKWAEVNRKWEEGKKAAQAKVDYWNEVAKREAENIEQQRAEAEAWAMGTFNMTLEELYVYEETLLPRLTREFEGFDYNEYYNNLAGNYENDTTRESESIGRGGEVLQGEQSVPASGAPAVGVRNEGGAVSNDVQGGGQNGVAQEEAINEPVGNSEQLSSSEIPNNQSVAEGDAPGQSGVYADNQGNPVDADGKLIVDEVNLIDEITDEDFETPTRNVQLPAIPENVANAIGTNGRPVVIKKNVFEKNGNTHVELEPEDSRNILRSALYNPNLVGSTQPIRRPDYKVAIRTGEQNAIVVLDVYQEKDFVEIVGWRMVNERGLAKMQRQAEREGGQFLILSPNDGSAAALSALPLGLSSASEDRNSVSNSQENAQKSGEIAENGGENAKTPMQKLADRILDRTEEKRRIPLRERARKLEAQVGVKANIIESLDEVKNREARKRIAAGEAVAGWYSGGQVYLYMPNIKDRREIELTYVHEVVAHHGVKKLLGERFNEFLDGVWNMMSEADRARMLAYVGAKENPTLQDMRAAADEYVAELAEKMNLGELEQSRWDKIVDWFKELLENIGFENLTKEDIESMLKASYANLKSTEQRAESKDGALFRTTYHGSGAKFDRFDHSFMGTGEGAQAFGWGTYVTEVEGIGKQYAETGNSGFAPLRAKIGNIDAALHMLDSDIERAKRELEQDDNETAKERAKYIIENAEDRRESLYKERTSVEKEMSKLGRNLYSVEIPDDNGSNYLYWDEVVPKKVETAVKERLLERLSEGQGEAYKSDLKQELDEVFRYSDFNGSSLYKNISAYLGGDKQASLFLNDMGFVGISYPANATTGGRADGARNYVIFNENDAEIKDRTMFRIADSERRQEKKRINDIIDTAAGFVTVGGKKQAIKNRLKKEAERKELAKEMYSSVLKGDFNDVTLAQIDKFIEDATPLNPFGRRISQRLPQRMERALRQGARTNAVDALFSRISESAVPANERFSEAGRREIEERKKELLKGWAIATGNWHTDLKEFTDDTEPIGEGKDSKVYSSKDGRYVIKASKGKPYGKRFRPDIDNIALFNDVFRDTRYEILGYGEIDGEFVRILQQPIVDFAQSTPLTSEERREYMQSLGFEPLNDANTAFADGEIVIADLQKGNVVRDAAGNISVIDADAKLHTKDVGGDYTYPPVEDDLPEQESVMQGQTMFRFIGERGAANLDRAEGVINEFNKAHKGATKKVVVSKGKETLEQQMRDAGFTDFSIEVALKNYEGEENPTDGAYYVSSDGIVIYDTENLDITLWHENTHRAIRKIFDGDLSELQRVYNELPDGVKEDIANKLKAKSYSEEDFPEESVCYFVEEMYKNGLLDNKYNLVHIVEQTDPRMKDFANFAQKLINYINNGRKEFAREGEEFTEEFHIKQQLPERNSGSDKNGEGIDEAAGGEEETRFSIREEGIDDVPTQPLTLMERITNSLLEVSVKNKENLGLRADALKAFGKDINRVLSVMKAQREYDKFTVDTLVKLAKMYFKNAQLLGEVTPYEVTRIMGVLNRSVGKRDVSSEATKLMDILLDAHTNALAGILEKAEKVKAKKVNAAGVEVMGRLDKYGQISVDEYRTGKEMTSEKLEEAIFDSDNRLAELEQRVREAFGLPEGDVDQAARDYTGDNDVVDVYLDERARLEGLMLARDYKESVQHNLDEIKDLKQELKKAEQDYRLGNIDSDSLKEFRKSASEAILQSKAELIEGYHDLIYKFQEGVKKSSQRANAFVQAQIDRAREIQHNANSDMEGIEADSQGKHPERFNNSVTRTLMSPMPTFQGMLKKFGEKNVEGKGYLYERFMPQATKASDNEFRGKVAARVMIETKLKEIYGGDMDLGKFMKSLREPGITVTYREGNKMKEFELTQGQMLYIYMVNKMSDGQMKLRRMGITDDVVAELMTKLPEDTIRFADWVQDELLKDLRGKYNAVHERVFGAPMAAIENYFPIKIRKEARGEKGDVSEIGQEGKPSTITGSIIKRTKNAIAIDLSADAMQVLMEHIDDMEHWAAFAEFNRDINTLLNYRHFQNQVKNMTSLRYGSGEEMWKNFQKTAKIVSGTYKSSDSSIDRAVQNIVKGLTRAKINFRGYTAVKQLLSAPAFWTDAGIKELSYCYVNPKGCWIWAKENLPGFAERWEGRKMGNEKLLKSDSDWEIWRNEFVEAATRWGMTPNAAIDALTVAQGARAVYMTKLKQFKKAGYTEKRANEKALQAAAEAYNESQQSSEGMYLSPLQVEGTALAAVFTTFKNSNFGYSRKVAQSVANVRRKMRNGYKEEAIAFMTKQMVRDGLSEDNAKKLAEKVYKKSWYKDIANVAMFGFALPALWTWGGYAIYMILGDDDEEKEKMKEEIALRGALGFLDGIPLGESVISAINAVKQGDAKYFRLPELIAVGDIRNLAQVLNGDAVRGANDVINIVTAMGVGVSPQILTDFLVAISEIKDFSLEEFGMFTARVMSAPQSNLDALMVDDAMENSAHNLADIAERYIQFKTKRNAPITQFFYSDETEQKVIERYAGRFASMLEDNFENVVDDNNAYDLFYDSASPEVKEVLASYRKNFLAGDKADDFQKKSIKRLVLDLLEFKSTEYSVYWNMTNPEDEETAFLIESELNRLEPIKKGEKDADNLSEYKKLFKKELNLYKKLDNALRDVNKYKRKMQKSPDTREREMTKIREKRAEAIELINNYRNNE